MIKIIIFIFTILSQITISCGQTPNWDWIIKPTGSNDEFPEALATDKAGNIYVAGLFGEETLTFDTITLYSPIGSGDGLFLVKYDKNGNALWASRTSSTETGWTNHYMADPIVIDDSGNVYLSGYFRSAFLIIEYDTLVNTDTLNGVDIFIAKYDKDGNFIWARSNGGHGWEEIFSIAIDIEGNICIGGFYTSSTFVFGPDTLINDSGYSDIFYAKYDPNGNALFAKSAGGVATDEAYSISTDNTGNIFLAGAFDSPYITFDAETLSYAGGQGSDMFVAKYDINGNVVWAKSFGGNQGDAAFSIATDYLGNAYMTGYYYSGYISFDNITINNPSTDKICLVKFDPNGNALWAKRIGGNGGDNRPQSVAVDSAGNVYISGYFYGPIIYMDLVTTLTNVNPSGTRSDLFIAKYDTDGNFIWAKSAGGERDDVASSIEVDNSGNIYTSGWFFSPTIEFDTATLINSNNSGYEADMFLAKIGKEPVGINEYSNQSDFIIYPNPSDNYITILSSTKSEIEIFNLQGQLLDCMAVDTSNTPINISGFVNGLYFMKVKSKNGVSVKKFIKG